MAGVVVVGIDGSDEARAALRWAADEARMRGWSLRLVTAYRFPLAYAGVDADPMIVAPELQEAAEQTLAEAVDAAGRDLEGLQVERVVVAGQGPASALVDRSREAELLVVGARGIGGLQGLLLGSVSQQCVQHAACPVLVVRPRAAGH